MVAVDSMEALYVEGNQDKIDYTPSAAVNAGTVLDLDGNIGIALNDLVAGLAYHSHTGEAGVAISGTYDMLNPDDTAFARGVQVDWDDTANKLVAVTTGDFTVGEVVKAHVSGEARTRVKINYAPLN